MNKEIIQAKLWAIATGLNIAKKNMLKSRKIGITIFGNSRKALNSLGQLSMYTKTPYLRKLICQKLSELEGNGKLITLKGIPGHVGLVEHDKADQITG